MIIRQRLPMALRVNVVPMRRRKKGLGDTCTPTSCAGPYDVPQYNYSYWAEQAAIQGAPSPAPGSSEQPLDTTAILAGAGAKQWASYDQMVAAACVEACDQKTVSDQWACSQRNMARDIQIGNLQTKYNSAVPLSALSELTCTPGPTGSHPSEPSSVLASTGASATGHQAVTYPNASVTFSTPRSGSVLYPGDAWTIRIQNAAPNAAVTVSGSDPGGNYSNTQMGTTDSSGNWALSGSIDSTQIGNWSETWSVGGQDVGSFSFTVQAAPAAATTSAATPPAATTSAAIIPAVTTGSWFTASYFSGIPNWALLAAAAVAVFAFGRGGKR